MNVNRRKGLLLGTVAVALIVVGAWVRVTGILAAAEVRAEFERGHEAVLRAGMPEVVAPPTLDDGHVVARDGLALRVEDLTFESRTTTSNNETRTSTGWRTRNGETRWARMRLDGRDVDPGLFDGVEVDARFALDADAIAFLQPKATDGSHKVFWGSGTPALPQAGDRMRVYTWVPRGEITVFAIQRGGELVRETRLRERFGVPMSFDIGVARLGNVDAATMAEVQRQRVSRGSWMFRLAGSFPIVVGGWVLIAAAGNWFGRRETGLTHPSQLVPWCAWLLVAWPLRWVERLVERVLAWPPAIAIACAATALLLAVAMVALFRWLPARFPQRRSRRRGHVQSG